jgi:hypothetical protein
MEGRDETINPFEEDPLDVSLDIQGAFQAEGALEDPILHVDDGTGGGTPAENARVATPGDAFQDDWTGGEGAGDFLELESSLGLEPEAGETDLMSFEAAPTTDAGQEELFGGDAVTEFEPFGGEEEHAGGSTVMRTLGLVVAGFGVGLAAMIGLKLLGGDGGDTTPDVAPTTAGVTTTAGATGGAADIAPRSAAAEPWFAPGQEPPPGSNLMLMGALAERLSLPSSVQAAETAPTVATGPDTQPVGPTGVEGPDVRQPVDPTDVPGFETPVFTGTDLTGEPFEVVEPAVAQTTGDDPRLEQLLDGMTMIWQGDEVPMDRIESPVKIMTPAVGTVRVVLDSGDVFEGRLWAIGEQRLWLDASAGRIGFSAAQLSSVERILGAPSDDAVEVTVGMVGRRMRAMTEGGRYIVGTVTKLDDSRVTLRTDAGALITLKDARVEPVGEHPAVRLKD